MHHVRVVAIKSTTKQVCEQQMDTILRGPTTIADPTTHRLNFIIVYHQRQHVFIFDNHNKNNKWNLIEILLLDSVTSIFLIDIIVVMYEQLYHIILILLYENMIQFLFKIILHYYCHSLGVLMNIIVSIMYYDTDIIDCNDALN